jgi:hypothetical protein
VVRVDLAARDRADPAGRVTVVDPGDMNRVVAATVGTAAVMAPAALVSQAVPVVRVGMSQVGPVGMILGDPEGRPRAPNPVVRVDPGSREATDLSLGRALLGRMPARLGRMPARLGRMPMRLHLTPAGPLLMPALLHPTPVVRRRDPTTRAEAIPAEATRAAAIRRAQAGRRAGATDGVAELSWRTDRKPYAC